MREHLGIDVDELMEHSIATEEELRKIQIAEEGTRSPKSADKVDSESLMMERQDERDMIERRHRIQDEFLSRSEDLHSFNHDVDWEQENNPNLKSTRKLTADPRVTSNAEHKKDVDGNGVDRLNVALEAGLGDGRDSVMLDDSSEVLVSPIASNRDRRRSGRLHQAVPLLERQAAGHPRLRLMMPVQLQWLMD
jgi:phospholipase D1/2